MIEVDITMVHIFEMEVNLDVFKEEMELLDD